MMRQLTQCLVIGSLILSGNAMAANQIWLTQVEQGKASETHAITELLDYVNQPLLTDSGVYFSQSFAVDSADATNSQTELLWYDFEQKKAINLTRSSVSEYSPTLLPDKSGLSSVVVEADGKQKLWRYPFHPHVAPSRIVYDVEPVGYHAWGIKNDVVMFILGEPHTLQYMLIEQQTPQVIATDIGRTLTYQPQLQQFGFTLEHEQQHWFATFEPYSSVPQIHYHFPLPADIQDYAWLDAAHIIFAKDNIVYQQPLTAKKARQWLDLSQFCQGKITRMSYLNSRLAFVCEA